MFFLLIIQVVKLANDTIFTIIVIINVVTNVIIDITINGFF